MNKPESVLENETYKILWDYEKQADYFSPNQKTTSRNNWQKEKRTCCLRNFTVPMDHGVKIKESEKKYKYLDLTRELKKMWKMNVTPIPLVISALGKVPKGLEKGIEEMEICGRTKTIQTTALLRLVRLLKRVQETWGDLLSLKFQWKTTSISWREKLARCNITTATSSNIIEKLAIIVEGDQKAPFSIATTPRYRVGHYFFPWIAQLYPWSSSYVAEC